MKDKLIDSAIILAVATAGIYVWGLVSLERYFAAFGLSLSIFEFATANVLLSALGEVLNFGIAASVVLIAYATLHLLPKDHRDAWALFRPLIGLRNLITDDFPKLGLGFALLLLFGFFTSVALRAGSHGLKLAKATIANPESRAVIFEHDGKVEKICIF